MSRSVVAHEVEPLVGVTCRRDITSQCTGLGRRYNFCWSSRGSVPARPVIGTTLSALMDDVLSQLQQWYARQCDGDWEHQYGVKVDTLDNPGWRVTIDLAGTDLEGRQFDPIERGLGDDSSTDWHSLSV